MGLPIKLSSATKHDAGVVIDFQSVAKCPKETTEQHRYQPLTPSSALMWISNKARQARVSWLESHRPCLHLQAGIALTVFLQVELLHSMDVTELCNASLDLCTSFSAGHINLFNHLLLPVNPVEPVLKDSQSHRLQDIGVFQNDPVSTCRRETVLWFSWAKLSETSPTPLSPLFFTPFMLLDEPATKPQAILGPLMQD